MANFQPDVLKKILDNEGGYVNDPDDHGGETWAGVARKINPNWSGWGIIDTIKVQNPYAMQAALKHDYRQIDVYLHASARLAELVAELYESSYWNVNRLGDIADQQLAANACDCGVNCGTHTGAITLQRAFNHTHIGIAPELVEDGNIGPATIAAINASSATLIYNEYNALRKAYYDGIIAKNPTQVKYKNSWYSRIIPYRS